MYKVVDSSGPSEAVMIEMLKLLREAFEFAVEDIDSRALPMMKVHCPQQND